MARVLWLLFMLGLVATLLAGASWAAAYYRVGTLLGAPPPQMGTQHTSFLWGGLPNVRGHPRVWRFAFAPTQIPGAPSVRFYISPTGRLVQTEPTDLPARLKDFRRPGY
jgi:hypothetical protein